MADQLGSVIGYPGYQQALQQRLQANQASPTPAPMVPSYGTGDMAAPAQAYDYSPGNVPITPMVSPKMSTSDQSGSDSTKKALKARQDKLGQTYPAVDPNE